MKKMVTSSLAASLLVLGYASPVVAEGMEKAKETASVMALEMKIKKQEGPQPLSEIIGKLGMLGYHSFVEVEREYEGVFEIEALDENNQEVTLYYDTSVHKLISQQPGDMSEIMAMSELLSKLESEGYHSFRDVDLKRNYHGGVTYYKVKATDSTGAKVKLRLDASDGKVMP